MERQNNYFGDCPKCGRTDGYLNYRSNHAFVCHGCKTFWVIGANLFSSWKYENEEIWEENLRMIEDYEEVEPLPWKPTQKEVAG
jgi:hypothetical protein